MKKAVETTPLHTSYRQLQRGWFALGKERLKIKRKRRAGDRLHLVVECQSGAWHRMTLRRVTDNVWARTREREYPPENLLNAMRATQARDSRRRG